MINNAALGIAQIGEYVAHYLQMSLIGGYADAPHGSAADQPQNKIGVILMFYQLQYSKNGLRP